MLGVVVLKSSQGQASSCLLMFGTNRLSACTTRCLFPHSLCVCHTLLTHSLTHCPAFYHSILHLFHPSHFMLWHSVLFTKTPTDCHYFSQLTANEKSNPMLMSTWNNITRESAFERFSKVVCCFHFKYLLHFIVTLYREQGFNVIECIINNFSNFPMFCITNGAFGVITTSVKIKS